jgi:hypothetical protein
MVKRLIFLLKLDKFSITNLILAASNECTILGGLEGEAGVGVEGEGVGRS